jgi:hypothetical protein
MSNAGPHIWGLALEPLAYNAPELPKGGDHL